MTQYFVGYWVADLTNPQQDFLPIGVSIQNEHQLEVRLIAQEQLPLEYRANEQITTELFSHLEGYFRTTQQSSSHPTNLYFKKLTLNLEGTLAEQAERLFQERVLPYYTLNNEVTGYFL